MAKLTFIDLFAGIGGFHLAFHNVGAECVFASEWDDAARLTYETNFAKISPKLFSTGDDSSEGGGTASRAGGSPGFDRN